MSNNNTSVATCNTSGMTTGVGVGQATIEGAYFGEVWSDSEGFCDLLPTYAPRTTICTINPRVRIFRDGQDITSTSQNTNTQNVIVGQKINLSATVSGGIPDTQQWVIPEKAVKKFETLDENNMPDNTRTPKKGRPVPIESNDLMADTISFTWHSGGGGEANKQVTFTVFINSIPYTAVAKFDVKRPTSTLTSMGGTTKVDNNNVPKLYLGGVNTTAGETGIVMQQGTTTIPTGYTGEFQLVQLINRTLTRRQVNQQVPSVKSDSGLDGCDHYDSQSDSIWTDSPELTLAGILNGTMIVYEFAKYEGTWNAYLMFRPTGTAGNNAEWVPLKKLAWNWTGEATLIQNSNPLMWNLNNVTPPGNPTGMNTTEYPIWTNIVSSNLPC